MSLVASVPPRLRRNGEGRGGADGAEGRSRLPQRGVRSMDGVDACARARGEGSNGQTGLALAGSSDGLTGAFARPGPCWSPAVASDGRGQEGKSSFLNSIVAPNPRTRRASATVASATVAGRMRGAQLSAAAG